MSKVLVIIPTYNESQNIGDLINVIDNLNLKLDFLVVDDNSPDKTYDIVKSIMQKNNRVNLIVQDQKAGLGTAYKKGFSWAITNNYDKVIQIDADMSHDPNSIPELIKESKKNDLIIGSRYIKGVNVVNWPMSRLLLSYFANVYVKILTWMPISDSTSGYKCISIEVLKTINLNKVQSQGYSFQIEINFLAYVRGFKIKEIPIICHDRTVGESKMSKSIILEAIFMVPRLALKRLFRKC